MLLVATLGLCIILGWVCFSVFEGFNTNINISIEPEPLQKLTIVYRMSKRRVNFLGPLFRRFRVIIICYTRLGEAVIEQSSPVYAVGIIVNEGNFETGIANYLISLLGYKVFVIPPSTLAITTSHPCKNPVSVHLVLRRMHKKMDYHVHRRRLCAYPNIEIYDGSSVRIIAPLTRQTQYYVPEVILQPRWSWCLNYDEKGDTEETEDFEENYNEEEEED